MLNDAMVVLETLGAKWLALFSSRYALSRSAGKLSKNGFEWVRTDATLSLSAPIMSVGTWTLDQFLVRFHGVIGMAACNVGRA
jgi:hypothetical protein